MSKKLLAYFIIFIASWGVAHELSPFYSYSDFKDYTSILLNVAGMVFTIMGIWIAFIYPNALNRLVDPKIENVDFSETLHETKRLESIVASVLKSAMVVVCIMLLFLGKILLAHTSFYIGNIELIKSMVLAILLVLSYSLIEAVGHVIIANVMFINDLHTKREDREADDSI
ncbi:hypothetical protein D8Y20_07255 [Mariprofundus sp. EBB-1]|uniref:hypothetical protein n=1 Tax=Mariprofundus sp. EBB-1 TaxID=2650971 RepID=UPI000EF1D26A|nr:hypothetical protein [Mariprofundus sp. EBB-1]RLL52303.1 hypothetical protein D8Y20_07255 [Mariprofundus sp. EBB-1]